MTSKSDQLDNREANAGVVEKVYAEYYSSKGRARNDIFNREVLFQHLAYEKCHIESFRQIDRSSRIVDVGGGSGAGVLSLLRYGFRPENISIVDIQPDRIEVARSLLPSAVNVLQCDASNMDFIETGSVDVATSSTMFLQILDPVISRAIAQEMIRVVRTGGKLLVFDWRYDFWKQDYVACDLGRMRKMFSVGDKTTIDQRVRGQLIPPLGRFLSKYCQSAYFIVQKIPFSSGLVCYVMTKR